MRAHELIDAIVKKLGTDSQVDLADALGVTPQTLSNWKNQDTELSGLQIASAIAKTRQSAVKQAQYDTIRPIVEFYQIDLSLTMQEKSYLIFDSSSDSTVYAQGLRKELDESNGIYIFYDSRGHSLYVGKAKEQSLWKEMNLAFNRDREIQTITLVRHPERNQQFKPGYDKLRQPIDTQLNLYSLAHYFSAYAIDLGMIDDLEALLVRGFANDLLNVKMETFAHSK